MHILGLDISSSKIGIALMNGDDLVISEVIKFKSNLSLEDRALAFRERMQKIERHYVIYDVYVEAPDMMFKSGSTAHVMAKLQRFNGMCCYVVREIFDQEAQLVNVRSARKVLNIKIPRGGNTKKIIIQEVEKRMCDQFKYNLTHKGNPQPGTDDRADAIIVALAGPLLE
jgi:RNase H-fold protein (predicted Holliday junction resolvase)